MGNGKDKQDEDRLKEVFCYSYQKNILKNQLSPGAINLRDLKGKWLKVSVLYGLVGGRLRHHQANRLNPAGSVDALALCGCATAAGASCCAADDCCCSAVAAFLFDLPS